MAAVPGPRLGPAGRVGRARGRRRHSQPARSRRSRRRRLHAPRRRHALTEAVMTLRVLALTCTLKPSPAKSSSDLIARQLLDLFAERGVTGEVVRVVDHDVRPGVEADMGEGDAWPGIRRKVAGADILLIASPTWVGHMSSVAQRVLERLDAELSETDEEGRPAM